MMKASHNFPKTFMKRDESHADPNAKHSDCGRSRSGFDSDRDGDCLLRTFITSDDSNVHRRASKVTPSTYLSSPATI
jgi:hypothetical protein